MCIYHSLLYARLKKTGRIIGTRPADGRAVWQGAAHFLFGAYILRAWRDLMEVHRNAQHYV
jgi:hypothetical protein